MKHLDKISVVYTDPSELRPNPWNPNKMDVLNEEKLDESIRQLGFVKPVIVRELADGTLEILGGEHRAESAVRLGMTEIPVTNLGRVSEENAQKIGLIDNGRYGEDDLALLSEVFKNIGSAEEIMSFLPVSDDEIGNIFDHDVEIDIDSLGLEELDREVEEIDLSEAMSATTKTHQIMRFKVSMEDAARVQEFLERIMSKEGYTESDAMTNAGDALAHVIYSHEEYGE